VALFRTRTAAVFRINAQIIDVEVDMYPGTARDVLSDLKIGTLASVTIARIPDRSLTSFGFLLPMIRLPKESAKQSFRTLGITTVDKTRSADRRRACSKLIKPLNCAAPLNEFGLWSKDSKSLP
jgi:hypothetical protein